MAFRAAIKNNITAKTAKLIAKKRLSAKVLRRLLVGMPNRIQNDSSASNSRSHKRRRFARKKVKAAQSSDATVQNQKPLTNPRRRSSITLAFWLNPTPFADDIQDKWIEQRKRIYDLEKLDSDCGRRRLAGLDRR